MSNEIDSFYKDSDIGINSEEWNIVNGFFTKFTDSKKTAEAFSVDLFRVSKSINVPVLDLLKSMNDKDTMGINETMAFYLNQIRSQSALLGVQNTITANQQVARNVLT